MAPPPPTTSTGSGGDIELLNIAGSSDGAAGVAWESIDVDVSSSDDTDTAAASKDFALPTSARPSAFSISATIPLPFDSVDELASVAPEQLAELTSSLSIEQFRIEFTLGLGLIVLHTEWISVTILTQMPNPSDFLFFPPRYGQIAGILNEEGLLSSPLTISFKNLGLEMGPKRLLHNVSGIIRPGEACCVLGAPDSVRSV